MGRSSLCGPGATPPTGSAWCPYSYGYSYGSLLALWSRCNPPDGVRVVPLLVWLFLWVAPRSVVPVQPPRRGPRGAPTRMAILMGRSSLCGPGATPPTGSAWCPYSYGYSYGSLLALWSRCNPPDGVRVV